MFFDERSRRQPGGVACAERRWDDWSIVDSIGVEETSGLWCKRDSLWLRLNLSTRRRLRLWVLQLQGLRLGSGLRMVMVDNSLLYWGVWLRL